MSLRRGCTPPVILVIPALTLVMACGPSDQAPPIDGSSDQSADGSSVLLARARGVHERITVLDSHAGFTGDPLRSCGETERQVDFSKMRQGGVDVGDFPYDVGHLLVEYSPIAVGLQLGSWRSVSHSFNVFAVNCFLDEIAVELQQDPLAFQLALLGEPRRRQAKLRLPGRRGQPTWDTGRLAMVLRLAADRSGRGQPLPRGRGRGIACCVFKDTVVAHVADVSVDGAGGVRVHRIVAAVDCGRVVNPDGVAAQVEGAAIDGVATVLKWGITYSRGRVEQDTFADFPLVTIGEAPAIETHVVPSEAEPSGMGEPPYPSVAPAIVNAIHAASGRRVRRLPLESQ